MPPGTWLISKSLSATGRIKTSIV
jgi:hypothetical protein